jgi:RNA polymerase sigma-70 factor (ECF subfamily)
MRSMADTRARAHDPATWDAFESRIARCVPEAYRLAAAMVGRDDAADVVQDALVEAWRHVGALRDPDRFEPWFRSIVANRSRNVLRARGRRPHTLTIDQDLPVVGAGHAPDEAVALRDGLDRAFERLSPEHRAILALRYTLDLPLLEIARTLEVPEGTVKSRLHTAVARLRAAYEEGGR